MRLAIKIWKQTLKTLFKNPIILLPFVIVGLFDAFSLLLVYLAPQEPFSIILAPPIRAFWGERFLHYPLNFVLLPRLFGYAHIVNTAIIGVLMTGLAIGMLNDAKAGNKPRALPNLIFAFKKYFIIFAIWLTMYILAILVYKIPALLITFNKAVFQIVFYLSFLIVILVEVVFIYAIPATIIEKRGLISAIRRGVLLSKSYFLTTFILVAILSLFYIPIMILRVKSVVLMHRLFPEAVLIVLGIGIVVTVLIDCIITCSTTTLFLNQERKL